MLLVAATVLLITVGVWYMRKSFLLWMRVWDGVKRLPNPEPPHWFAGHENLIPEKQQEANQRFVRLQPNLYRVQMGPLFSAAVAVSPSSIGDVLKCKLPKNTFFYSFFKEWLGTGLFTSDGKRWERDRRLLSHAFSSSMLRAYVPVYKEAAQILCRKLADACQVDTMGERPSNGMSVNVTDPLQLMAFDVIIRCTLGQEMVCQTGDSSTPQICYVRRVLETAKLVSDRYHNPLVYSSFIYLRTRSGRRYLQLVAETNTYVRQIVRDRRVELSTAEDGNTRSGASSSVMSHRGKTMMDVLLEVRGEDIEGLNDEEISDQLNTFLFAGHDTTSATLQWALHYLSQHRDVQDKCRSEVTRVIEACGGIDKLEHENLADLQYLSQTINETLRIVTPASELGREIRSGSATLGGVELPEGAAVIMGLYQLHNNPTIWEDPERFDPDRFAPGRAPTNRLAFIPFSAGPRNCIGQHFALDEMKLVLAMLLFSFRFRPDPAAPVPKWMVKAVSKPDPYVKLLIEEA